MKAPELPPGPGGKKGKKGAKGGNWFQQHKAETYAGAGVGGLLLLLYLRSHQTPQTSTTPGKSGGLAPDNAAYDAIERQMTRLQGSHGPHKKTPTPKTGPPPKKGKPPTDKKGHCPPGYFWDPDDLGGKGRCVKKAGHKGPDNGTGSAITRTSFGSLLAANRGASTTTGAEGAHATMSVNRAMATTLRPSSKRRSRVRLPATRINGPAIRRRGLRAGITPPAGGIRRAV